MLLLFNWPPICEVFPNQEVTKPRIGTSLELGSVAYCYVTIIYAPLRLLSLPPNVRPRGQTTLALPLMPFSAAQSISAQDDLPTRASPVFVPELQKFPASLDACCSGSSAQLSVAYLHPLLNLNEKS